MITYKVKKVEQKIAESITCDVCKKTYYYRKDDNSNNNDDIMEIQEFLNINFRGGYCSIFGDDVLMRGDICQHCLKEKLGEYLVTVED